MRAELRLVVHTNMGSDVSRNGKIGAGVVLFLVLAVVAVLAVGSAVGWYEEELPPSLGPPPGQKERVSITRTALPTPAGRSHEGHLPAEELTWHSATGMPRTAVHVC